jgi:aspartate kinase
MIVMKFGGTSVGDAAAIERVAEIVRSRRNQLPVVIVSAFAKVTDQLVQMGQRAASGDYEASMKLLKGLRERHFVTCKKLLSMEPFSKMAGTLRGIFGTLEDLLRGLGAVREVSPRSSDYLLSFGELLSSQIVCAALTERGFSAAWVDSRKCFATDDNHTRARPLFAETRQRARARILPHVAKIQIPVLGGFIAATKEGVPTTLGRGGSDYSAAILGAVLGAARIEIWTDVEGMMTTDPRLCPNARTISQISFNEAAELAYFGAKVLHPATLLPAIEKNIPVYILNSRNLKSKGTRITARAPRSKDTFRAITAKTGVSIVNVAASRGVMVHGFLRSVFDALDRHATSVDIVAISEVSLSFTMQSGRLPHAVLADLEQIADVTCEDKHAIVCLVGDDIHGKPGIAASVFNTVAAAGVNVRMISQGASEINISFVIAESDVPRAVRQLHAHFFPIQSAGSPEKALSPGQRGKRKAASQIKANGASQTPGRPTALGKRSPVIPLTLGQDIGFESNSRK